MLMRMIFKKEVANAKAVLMTGQIFLVLSIAWPRLIPLSHRVPADARDLIQGLLLGVSLGLMFWAARLGAFRRPGRLS